MKFDITVKNLFIAFIIAIPIVILICLLRYFGLVFESPVAILLYCIGIFAVYIGIFEFVFCGIMKAKPKRKIDEIIIDMKDERINMIKAYAGIAALSLSCFIIIAMLIVLIIFSILLPMSFIEWFLPLILLCAVLLANIFGFAIMKWYYNKKM